MKILVDALIVFLRNPRSGPGKIFFLLPGHCTSARWLPAIAAGSMLLAGCGSKDTAGNGALAPIPTGSVGVYFFWGDGCPHCAQAEPFLESLAQREPRMVLRSYEVWYHKENQAILQAMADRAGFEPQYVPTILIGSRYWEGYDARVAQEMESALAACLQNGCPDPGAGIVSPLPADPAGAAPVATLRPADPTAGSAGGSTPADAITLPLIGTVDLSTQSLAVSTLLIALVDGFNPCSVWVLTMLLALTLHTGSRRKVILIGLIFLTVTAAIYGLFITGLFTMFTVLSFTGWIQVIVALVALVFALVNIKDYFWYKEGVSFTISDSKKPGLAQHMRALMDPDRSFWSLAGGTVLLSAGVSLVEFSCTAGFPVLWTNLLAAQGAGTAAFLLLLLLYLIIYQADEMVIFGAAVYSLRASRLEEKHGRILKLVGGMLMLTLSAVMLIQPSLMNNLGSSLVIFGITLLAVLLVLLAHRVILPGMGIRIGSEFSQQQGRRGWTKTNRNRRA
jgi:thiol-disulfide isomerase/thioredoxin